MLGKLTKYEFKATARIFLPLFAAVLAVSAVTRVMLGLRWETPHVISIVLAVMLIAAAFVMTLVLTIQRFYKNFMTDEGYLTFTLPVTTGRLIWAKLIVAAVWTVVCAAVVFLSVALMALSAGDWQNLFQSIRELGLPKADQTLFILEFLALVLSSLLTGILTIYASMALSMVANKHRVSLSFVFYIALNTVMQILISILLWIFVSPDFPNGLTFSAYMEVHTLGVIHAWMLTALGVVLAFGAGMFATTRYMLKKQLNLQ